MWTITIALDNQRPSKVVVTAENDGFSYSETLHFDKFEIASFVQEVIKKRDKWIVDRTTTLTTANAIAKDILTALNLADGIKGMEIETVANNNVVRCAKKVEPIEEPILLMKELKC